MKEGTKGRREGGKEARYVKGRKTKGGGKETKKEEREEV